MQTWDLGSGEIWGDLSRSAPREMCADKLDRQQHRQKDKDGADSIGISTICRGGLSKEEPRALQFAHFRRWIIWQMQQSECSAAV